MTFLEELPDALVTTRLRQFQTVGQLREKSLGVNMSP